MAKIDLKKILEDSEVMAAEAARVLFPNNTYPDMAIRRVLTGESELNASQIISLSKLLNCEPGDLFKSNWRAKMKGKMQVYTNSGYTAIFDPETFNTEVHGPEGILCEFQSDRDILMRHYIALLEHTILQYK